MKRELQQLRNCNSSKADALEMTHITQRIHELVAVVESLQQESSGLRSAITQKLDVDDAAQLVESCTTLVGLNSAMQHVERAMAEDFVTKSELQGVTQQVQAIQQQLRSELFHARYIWKEGRPSATKQTISWDTQIVNTRTDIFVWKRGSDQILLKIPGLYHLQAAFFTDFAPTIHILVNGEPALVYSAGEDDSALLANSGPKYEKEKTQNGRRPGPSVRRVHHSAGNIVGVAMDALLALPARAVVQIAYDIDENAQGFLSLRKL
uniref:C1q domain-containing protein n=1 Tax=Globisporangium ultimum (strain ATCC 200006 / CBS 805.95 / DAOM BR144) TaxID=431595 RepID=K3WZW8_GLOUD